MDGRAARHRGTAAAPSPPAETPASCGRHAAAAAAVLPASAADGGVRAAHQCCSAARLETHHCCRAVCLPGRASLHGHRPSASRPRCTGAQTFSHPFVTSALQPRPIQAAPSLLPCSTSAVDAAAIVTPAARSLSRCQAECTPSQHTSLRSQHLTLDEAMAAFKGRSPIKQYIPSKPHKWGYKIYCLASEDYLLHFEIYEGRRMQPSDGRRHLRHGHADGCSSIEDQQHVLFTDNWFTSPALAARTAAERHPPAAAPSVAIARECPPSRKSMSRTADRASGCRDRRATRPSLCGRIRRPMWLLYNHCSPGEAASLDRWNEAGDKVSIGCPRAIRDYFYGARSVDVLSQLHYAYLPGRKAMRCWPRLAWWLLDMCIINAFKLWSIGREHRQSARISAMQLMHQLLEQLPAGRRAVQARAHPRAEDALAKDHYPECVNEKRDCAVCSHRPENRVQSRLICHACRVHLCAGPCFSHHHA